MRIFDDIIAVFWLIFIVYWLMSAIGVKSDRHGQGVSWWREVRIRIAIGIPVTLFAISPLRRYLVNTNSFLFSPIIGSMGVALCGIGIAFAIWARVYLGRNWGMPMTLKEEPALITHGPYAVVRHPIYAGIILAMIGSTLVIGLVWLVVVVILCPYFLYSAIKEERLMIKEFPDQYHDYKRRTKMLVPFIF